MSKGGSTTSQVQIPEYIDAAARRNLDKAERISQIGFVPYEGADVAAFTPMQQAAFQNTANLAGEYGMASPTSQSDIMGGMPEPTTYAGGVKGYSAAPLYQEAIQTLGEKRPGQKAFIDSFFINPYTGGASAGNFSPISYAGYGSGAGSSSGSGTNLGGISYGTPNSTMTYDEAMRLGDIVAPGAGYNPMTDVLTAEQQAYVNDPANTAARIAQEDLNMSITGNANNNILDSIRGLMNDEPSFADPYSTGSYGGSLVTGGLSGDFTPIPGNYGSIADNIVAAVSPSYAIKEQGKDFAAVGGSTYNPSKVITNEITGSTSTGGYDFDPAKFNSSYNTTPATSTALSVEAESARRAAQSQAEVDLPGNAISRALNIGAGKKDSSSGSGYSGSSNDGTVLCTAYASMGYLPADIWSLDARYGIKRFRQEPVMVSGYRLWAAPIARFIKTDGLAAGAVRAVLWPVVRAWAEEMAHTMKPEKYSGNKFGKLIMAIGEPFSYAVGATFLKLNAQKEL